MTACAALAGDPANPSSRLEAVFRRIEAERMRDLPFLNDRLTVEAVGFRLWQQSWSGVLITPWGINLLQLPAPDTPFPPARADAQIEVALPGGVVAFMPAHEAQLGDYRLCSLYSPAQQFADQEAARLTAQHVMALLFEPEQSQPPQSDKAQPDRGRRRMLGL
ncbi:MAG: [NiFe]-hydrogenase assembly chaperone HybE [Burkholderiaceae bacterium]|jgi:[NiFe] hydrogenase assembly HybE family chaperone|nr:[NiFe]-hydrogenase assembly chaperone HybE [Burkholderiaceae bacterium]